MIIRVRQIKVFLGFRFFPPLFKALLYHFVVIDSLELNMFLWGLIKITQRCYFSISYILSFLCFLWYFDVSISCTSSLSTNSSLTASHFSVITYLCCILYTPTHYILCTSRSVYSIAFHHAATLLSSYCVLFRITLSDKQAWLACKWL